MDINELKDENTHLKTKHRKQIKLLSKNFKLNLIKNKKQKQLLKEI